MTPSPSPAPRAQRAGTEDQRAKGPTRRTTRAAATIARAALGAALALGAAGCISPPSLSPVYAIPNELPVQRRVLSRQALILSDTQIHHLYGQDPYLRSEFTTRFIKTAIRPPVLDFYGRYLLEDMIGRTKADVPILYLGDALDMSCEDEWPVFEQAMKGHTFLLAPGNHDGFYFGVYHPLEARSVKDWSRACSGKPLDKAAVIARYLETLAQSPDPSARALGAQWLGRRKPASGTFRAKTPGSLLVSARWRIDKKEPWRSYIAQEVDLSLPGGPQPVTALLLDSSAFDTAPQIIPESVNAGSFGDLVDEQIAWMNERAAAARASGAVLSLMMHHPYDALRSRAQKAIDQVRQRFGLDLFVSAHTHEGRWYIHGQAKDTWPELNMGSTLDWPPENRLLSFYRPVGEDQILVYAELTRLADDATDFADQTRCGTYESWEAKPGDPDFYLTYKDFASSDPEASQKRLMNNLLSAFRRLLGRPANGKSTDESLYTKSAPAWPPGSQSDDDLIRQIDAAIQSKSLADKTTLLAQLDRFERQRQARDEARHTKYRLCQALWASKYAFVGARGPRAEDWILAIPRR